MSTVQVNRIEEEWKGFKIHALVSVCVIALLICVNLIVCPEFLWFFFPLTGMGIGVAFHYFLGVIKYAK